MAQSKSLTVNFFGRDVTLNKTLDGIKKNTFATSNVLEQGSKKATYVLAGLGAAALKFAKAAADDEKGAASLAQTLKTVTNASAAQIAGVEAYISKAELFSTIADDKIRPAFDTLARATGSIGKAQNMTNLALEIATKTGADVTEVADAMAKASRGQFKALVNLTKIAPNATKANTVYGTSMKVVNGQLVTVQKTMGKTQKTTESLEAYLKRVGVAYKGSIAGQSQTAAYKMAQFQVAMDHVQETLGAMLLPYLKDFADWLMKIEPFVEKHKDAIFKWGVAIAGMAVSIKLLNGAYKAFKITEAIVQFGLLGKAAATAGAETASAGAIAAAGWAWLAVAVAGVVALTAFANWSEKNRKKNQEKYIKSMQTQEGRTAFDLKAMYGVDVNKMNLPKDTAIKEYKPGSIRSPHWWNKLPFLAAGGIVTKPTIAMIGEAGPEAVVPLNKGMGGVTIINYIQGSVVTEKELSLKIRNDMAQLLRRKGINPSVLGV